MSVIAPVTHYGSCHQLLLNSQTALNLISSGLIHTIAPDCEHIARLLLNKWHPTCCCTPCPHQPSGCLCLAKHPGSCSSTTVKRTGCQYDL
ncbi:hypothetical protein XELAEV_18001891mg [Xenopus laevis]|uniref:Uncharacterized protein n=1 Tax=Xenopus laevis TaxID=8355 RepID=A0A974BNS6_XENLA|nr:hypothetical protein XELAEV_18001891mg [Xenopus laevis]